ncbi:aquaporin Z [Lyngbya aestuarii]|uniref:aquaporin Z n=1 Tax=Lyngbya aestuarii TaxID=118322 RepID=UPI00403DEABB
MISKKGRIFVAEMIGTFVLVFGGCGSAVLAGEKIGYLGVSFAFGLSLLIMVYAIGGVSGCHINPAVTVGLVFAKKLDKSLLPYYIIAQIVGGIIGGGILYLIASGTPGFDISAGFATNGYGSHSPGSYNLVACAIAEIVLTFFLLFTIMGTTHPKFPPGFAGISIGLSLVLIHLVGIPVTNTSVNPARSIGVAIFQGGWALQQLWLFLIAPFLGGILAVYAYQLLKPELKSDIKPELKTQV